MNDKKLTKAKTFSERPLYSPREHSSIVTHAKRMAFLNGAAEGFKMGLKHRNKRYFAYCAIALTSIGLGHLWPTVGILLGWLITLYTEA